MQYAKSVRYFDGNRVEFHYVRRQTSSDLKKGSLGTLKLSNHSNTRVTCAMTSFDDEKEEPDKGGSKYIPIKLAQSISFDLSVYNFMHSKLRFV